MKPIHRNELIARLDHLLDEKGQKGEREAIEKYFTVVAVGPMAFAYQLREDVEIIEPAPGLEGFGTRLTVGNWFARRKRSYRYWREFDTGRHTLVAEGDSWFQHPLIRDTIDHLSNHYNIKSLGAAGDTADNMARDLEVAGAVRHERPRGVLLSAGGNDLFDALNGIYPKGEEFQRLFPTPTGVVGRYDPSKPLADHLTPVFDGVLDAVFANYDRMLNAIREATETDWPVEVFVHAYDYVRPYPDAVLGDKRSWLGKPLADQGFPEAVRRDFVKAMINRFQNRMTHFASQQDNVHLVQTVGTLDDIDRHWDDEIHPTRIGYSRIASRFRETIERVLPPVRGRGLESARVNAKMLDPVAFREGWERNEKLVCTIELPGLGEQGTGVLIGPDLVLTNAHVVWGLLPRNGSDTGDGSTVELVFDFKRQEDTVVDPGRRVRLADDWLVAWRPYSEAHDPGDRGGLPDEAHLDYAVLRTTERLDANRGWLDLTDLPDQPPADESFLAILQHPQNGPQSVGFGEVVGLNGNGTRLRHRVNTLGGSSGSPCFDHLWRPVALHHGGDPNYDVLLPDSFNQGIPIGRIVADLEQKNVLPISTAETNVAPTTPLRDSVGWRYRPRLVVLCPKDEQPRASALVDATASDETIAAGIGNEPPATVADNVVGVYLGSANAPDGTTEQSLRDLRSLELGVIPVVDDVEQFYAHIPESLHTLNGTPWPRDEAAPPDRLTSRVRQQLGLEVDPDHRKVFVSYCRQDSQDQVLELKAVLERGGYDAFVDLEDIPPGEVVQEMIDRKLDASNCRAVLFIDSVNAQDSEWIDHELWTAQLRGLPIIVVRLGDTAPHPAVALLRSYPLRDDQQLAGEAGPIAKRLDEGIAQASTSDAGLARILNHLIHRDLKDGTTVGTESMGAGKFRATFTKKLVDRPVKKSLILWRTPHRPTAETVKELVKAFDEDQTGGSNTQGAVLLYESRRPLKQRDADTLTALCGDRSIWWIGRFEAETQLAEVIGELTGG